MITLLKLIFVISLALLPTYIAIKMGNDSAGTVFIFSVIFGWTGIGWLLGLFYAILKD